MGEATNVTENYSTNISGYYTPINYGWICPKCGSVYSPTTSCCPRCSKLYEVTCTYGGTYSTSKRE